MTDAEFYRRVGFAIGYVLPFVVIVVAFAVSEARRKR